MPEDVSIIVEKKNRKNINDDPKMIAFEHEPLEKNEEQNMSVKTGTQGKCRLYHITDHVYFKPRTVLKILFRIRQPKDRGGSNKPVSFLQTPRDFAEFKVMQDLLRQKVMK